MRFYRFVNGSDDLMCENFFDFYIGMISDLMNSKCIRGGDKMRKALEGVRVVQLANFIAAAATGRYLADHGAEVVIVEAAKGDPIRYTEEQEGRPQDMLENTTWEYLNGNKKCISLNTKTEEGKAALFKMLETTDVLITNWRIGALERAGLDYETLKERFPRLIYSMILGYGKTGPDKDLPGFDFTAFFARGGYSENVRRRGGDITISPGLGDNNVGLMLAMGITTALFNREKTGKGDLVTTSLYETAIFNQSVMLLGAQYEGSFTRNYPITRYDDKNPLNGAYETKDGRMIQCSCPGYDPKFEPFMTAIGRTDLIGKEGLFPQAEMIASGNIKTVVDEIMATFKKYTHEEMDEMLVKGDIPHSLCYSWKEILEDPQAEAIGAFYEVTCPNGVKRKISRTPVRLESEGEMDTRRGPLIGEHGREVLKEVGYSDADVDKMLESGALYIWDPEKDNK